MSISNNALIFYHTYTIESKKKSVYFTDFFYQNVIFT